MARRHTTAGLLIAGLALAACATDAPAPVYVGTTGGSPAPVAGYDWFFSSAEGEAELKYGVAETDDIPLGFSCRVGSGSLRISAPGPSGAREIHLEAGGDNERFGASAEPSEIHDGDDLYAVAPASHPVFQRFRRIGWIAVLEGDARTPLVAQPGTGPSIARFFQLCG